MARRMARSVVLSKFGVLWKAVVKRVADNFVWSIPSAAEANSNLAFCCSIEQKGYSFPVSDAKYAVFQLFCAKCCFWGEKCTRWSITKLCLMVCFVLCGLLGFLGGGVFLFGWVLCCCFCGFVFWLGFVSFCCCLGFFLCFKERKKSSQTGILWLVFFVRETCMESGLSLCRPVYSKMHYVKLWWFAGISFLE